LDLAAFPALTKLNLGANNITGVIPAANITRLTYLDLSQNSLSGEIPDTLPAMMPGMSYLNLSSNQLHGPIPRSLSDMPEMREFDV
jgi:Leucine-rich repeat (LRR) protein